MNPFRLWIYATTIPVLFLWPVIAGTVSYAGERPEIIRLDASYTENAVRINVHWQAANPIALLHAVIGGETREIKVDPYENRRNPDGYSGESVITLNVPPPSGGNGIPYVVQIEDDLRQKSEQVTGNIRTKGVGAGEGGGGSGSESWAFSDGWSPSGAGAPPPGDQSAPDAWTRARQGQPGELIDDILSLVKGNISGDDGGGGGAQTGGTGPPTLLNDSGSVAGFLPLSPGDEVAVYLDNRGQPFTVTKVYFLFGGSPDTGIVTIKISEGSGTPGNLQLLYSETFNVPGLDTDFQVLDLASYGVAVPVRTGSVWVSLQMGHDGLPGIGIDTSTNAVAGRNWIREGGSWSKFTESFEDIRQKNAIIRTEISASQGRSQESDPDSSQAGINATDPPSETAQQSPSGKTVETSPRPVHSERNKPAPVYENGASMMPVSVKDPATRKVPSKTTR
ncbi:MAG: hypothetical protein JSV00_00830 [bacterium]|nr:MAG: hypothetical protein JSV00_00830 [bacterium]